MTARETSLDLNRRAVAHDTASPWAAWWPSTTNRRVASTRLRCFALVEGLNELGCSAAIYGPGRAVPRVLVLSKRYDPETLAHAQHLRKQHGTRLVFDLCDNHLYNPYGLPEWTKRAEQLRATLASSDLVVASTEPLADVLAGECRPGTPIRIIGDAVEPERSPAFRPSPRRLLAEYRLLQFRQALPKTGTRLVWFGNHGSGYAPGGMTDLSLVKHEIEDLARSQPISLTVISNNKEKFDTILRSWKVRKLYLKWNEATFSRALRLHHIAIIPIGPNPFTLCKTNNRLATALLHGLAVVADSIPSYEPFSSVAVLSDWRSGLDLYAKDSSARQAAVQAGQALVRDRWSSRSICRQWIEVIQSV